MNREFLLSLVGGVLALFISGTSHAQMTPAPGPPLPAPAGTMISECAARMRVSASVIAPLANAPYSASQEFSASQTLADGTHITQNPQEVKLYRDSAGRTRTENEVCAVNGREPGDVVVSILDPVAGYQYYLDPQKHIAYRFAVRMQDREASGNAQFTMPQSMPNANSRTNTTTTGGQTNATRPELEVNSELLGSDTIEGVYVEGKRTSLTLPEGMAGNDRPITLVTECWYSPELQLMILDKSTDPRSGDRVMRLTNIGRSEPDIALFQPPPGYQVIDETGLASPTPGLP